MSCCIDEFFKQVNLHPQVYFFGKTGCKYCKLLENELASMGVPFCKYELDTSQETYSEQAQHLMQITGMKTFPMLYIGQNLVGGYDSFKQLVFTNKFEELLNVIGINIDSIF